MSFCVPVTVVIIVNYALCLDGESSWINISEPEREVDDCGGGTQAIPSHLTPNWALITQTPLLCFVVVGAQWVWRGTHNLEYSALFFFIPECFLSHLQHSTKSLHFSFLFRFCTAATPASFHQITSYFTSTNASPCEAKQSTWRAILRSGRKKRFALFIIVILFTGHSCHAEMIADVE